MNGKGFALRELRVNLEGDNLGVMGVDYDLVVLGGSTAGAIAAQQAARWGARVAWVQQGNGDRSSHRQIQGLIWGSRWRQQAQWIGQMGATAQDGSETIVPSDLPSTTWGTAWSEVQHWSSLIAALPAAPTPTDLTQLGVDILPDTGQLQPGRPLTVAVAERRLSTRRVLIALAGEPRPPAFLGETTIPYLTPAQFVSLPAPPAAVVILGSSPEGVALAQALTHWGTQVALVTPAPNVLPEEDPAVDQGVTAQLMAAGVAVYLGATPQKVAPGTDGVQVHLQDQILHGTVLLLATAPRPSLEAVNLAAVGLTVGRQGLRVNRYLQTINPAIYACGSALGGYDLAAVHHYEAAVAVENALFWPRRSVDYGIVPYGLPTTPEMGRVGLTEPQARRRYGASVQVYTTPWDHHAPAHWRGDPTGFCKLVLHRRGLLLGAHLVGPEARELVAVLALALAQKLSIQTLATLPTLPDSLMAQVQITADQWRRDRSQPGHWQRDWGENWCHWRRS
ncbi:FAD-dependent oxidoreductase [Leptolyngbya sp. PCC 6406]|uniref:FAD-dependent oxidoreductase n=1 Tax=Leptolyngbya sp. PCC 6406 TaxID=1173264 RepID=UPI0002ACAC9D|nr:FAD-dependent oxidoreductase [Leptolyngbya sp. PCC 6406]